MREREGAADGRAGRMNVLSAKFISRASACILSVDSPRPSRKTAS
jgi:hypothetical protein